MMTLHQHLTDPIAIAARRTLFATLRTYIGAWAQTCADYYAASGIYERMSRLSDAELRRRGLDRKTLARDIAEAAARRGDHR
jgi:hypothetical protein